MRRQGDPVAEVRPQRPKRQPFVAREDLLEVIRRTPAIDAARWRAERDEIIDQSV